MGNDKRTMVAWAKHPVMSGGRSSKSPTATASPSAAPAAARSDAHITGIQKAMQKLGYDPGKIDGVMGPHTKEAIKKFQQANALTPDGILGPKTQAALTKVLQSGAVPATVKPVLESQGAAAAVRGPTETGKDALGSV